MYQIPAKDTKKNPANKARVHAWQFSRKIIIRKYVEVIGKENMHNDIEVKILLPL